MTVSVKTIHYYGVIAGICEKINLVEEINRITESNPQRKVSVGQCVLAMMINGMGLTMSKPLYLTQDFFKKKPVDYLIGDGIKPEDLNDDTLGRALDEISRHGSNKIFSTISINAANIYGINTKFLHGDTSNVQVHGDYEDGGDLITFGYAKHGRPDLKQYLLSLISTADGAIPLFAGAIRGNSSDSVHFRDLIKLIETSIKESPGDYYFVLDSAAYCKENLKTINKLLLVTRVPERIAEVTKLKESYAESLYRLDGDENYKFAEEVSTYGGVSQRWIVVYSKMANERAKKTVAAIVKKEKKELERILKKISKQKFACDVDAQNAVSEQTKKCKFHAICITKTVQISPPASKKVNSDNSANTFYMVETKIEECLEFIDTKIILDSMFILATTQLDREKLSAKDVLSHYKEQSKAVENRFNLFKNSTCIANKVYLKSEKRIEALVMILCLCLLVYALAETQLRKALVAKNKSVPNQVKKETQNPTMRWIFQMFEDVCLVTTSVGTEIIKQIENLSEPLKDVLEIFGTECMNKYPLHAIRHFG